MGSSQSTKTNKTLNLGYEITLNANRIVTMLDRQIDEVAVLVDEESRSVNNQPKKTINKEIA